MKVALIDENSTIRLMKALDFFAEFTDDELKIMVDRKQVERYYKDEVIVWEGHPGCHFYIILNGKVIVTKRVSNSPIITQLGELGTGDCFGEMAIVTGKPRAATIQALTDAVVFSVSADVLNTDIYDHLTLSVRAKLYKNFAKELAKKLDSYNAKAMLLL